MKFLLVSRNHCATVNIIDMFLVKAFDLAINSRYFDKTFSITNKVNYRIMQIVLFQMVTNAVSGNHVAARKVYGPVKLITMASFVIAFLAGLGWLIWFLVTISENRYYYWQNTNSGWFM